MDGNRQMFSKVFAEPQQQCPSGQIVASICVRDKCNNPSLFCSDKNCPSCYEAHLTCNRIPIDLLANLLKRATRGPQEHLLNLFDI